jgi:hypothetical protein
MKYELTGNIINGSCLSFDAYGCPIVFVKFDNWRSAMKMVDDLKNCETIDFKISEHQKKRSLDANAYAWVLISKIAEKTNIAKNEVYRSAIKEIGGNSDTVCIQSHAAKQLCAGWERNGIGWCTEAFPSKLDGCTNVILYYGSSTYDSSQMNRLINILVQECEQLNIETKSPAELASLLGSWGGKQT